MRIYAIKSNKFFEILEGAGGLLDFDLIIPLIGIQVLILFGVLAFRLFLSIMQLQTVREFSETYLHAVLQNTKNLMEEVYGLRRYLNAVKLALLEAFKGADSTLLSLISTTRVIILNSILIAL